MTVSREGRSSTLLERIHNGFSDAIASLSVAACRQLPLSYFLELVSL